MTEFLFNEAIVLLKQLISIESFSKQEHNTANAIVDFLSKKEITAKRLGNNIWAKNKYFDSAKPTILLNSHHDTVRPNSAYTRNPFEPTMEDGKLFGLGSNDAGGALVSLLAVFLNFYDTENLKYNLIFAASAEEENSGADGIESILPQLGEIDFGIVGEPTNMHLAIAEKGLLVIDCEAIGKSGHIARDEGTNAIYIAMKDIEWFQNFKFDKTSALLGPIKMSVSMIKAGIQHNIVPETCTFTVDIRTTEQYTNQEILNTIKENISSKIKARSVRLNPSSIDTMHPIVQAGIVLGRETYGSPTTSDQALMNFSTLKIGPGCSSRSHSADEYIYTQEIKDGIELYINLLKNIL